MAYSTPALFVSGAVLTATQMNVLRSDFEEVAKPPIGIATVTATQSITHNLITTMNVTSTSTLRGLTFASNQFTIGEAGYYLVTAHVYWAVNATGIRDLRLLQNGTVITEQHDTPGTPTVWQHHSLVYGFSAAVNDTIKVEVYQTCGVALNLNGGSSLAVQMLSRL